MKYLVASQVEETRSKELKICGSRDWKVTVLVSFDGTSDPDVPFIFLKVNVPPLRIWLWHRYSQSHPALDCRFWNSAEDIEHVGEPVNDEKSLPNSGTRNPTCEGIIEIPFGIWSSHNKVI